MSDPRPDPKRDITLDGVWQCDVHNELAAELERWIAATRRIIDGEIGPCEVRVDGCGLYMPGKVEGVVDGLPFVARRKRVEVGLTVYEVMETTKGKR